MAELKFKPVRHSHKEFLAEAATREGFVEAYDALALEYQVANQMLKAYQNNRGQTTVSGFLWVENRTYKARSAGDLHIGVTRTSAA